MRNPEVVTFEIDAAEMAVRLAGDQEKPALLLIHGFPSSSASFRRVIGPIARDCFMIAPDLPGFGGSEPKGHDLQTRWRGRRQSELRRRRT